MNQPTNAEIKIQLDRVERMLRTLVKEKTKSTWIKAGRVMEITGWNRGRLRQMRDHGCINWKKDNGFFYELESIPNVFLKHTLHENISQNPDLRINERSLSADDRKAEGGKQKF